MNHPMTRMSRARRAFRTATNAVRSVLAPAGLVHQEQEQPVPVPAVNPVDVYTLEEMPPAEVIEAAASDYATACDLARAADRGKRKAKKLLGRLPAGLYGRWLVEQVPSSRQTPDLEAIRATYARLDLGEVPMRTCAPSLRVTAAAEAAVSVEADRDQALALAG